jgi:predicted TPR repeat methyltransferase
MPDSPAPARVAAPLNKNPTGTVNADDRAAQLERAVQLLRDESLDEADAAFDAYLRHHPDDADGVHYQGILRHTQGRVREALDLLRESLELAPQHAGYWNNYGNVLLERGWIDQALQAYERCLEVAPEDDASTDALLNLSVVHRKQGNLMQAERCARDAIARRGESGDAWYALSLALMAQKNVREALVANSRAIALWPRHQQARDQVIRALVMLGQRDEAAKLYRQWLADEPDNPVVAHQLAACLGRDAPARASDAYVEQVFDAFSHSFDAKLEALNYRAPQRIEQALTEVLSPPDASLRVADLGCGTGLLGPLLRPWAASLAGCDLSVGMLRKARQRAVYDVLHKAELTHYLNTQPEAFDLVACADTLCYLGDLTDVHHATARALRPGGHLAYTVEAIKGTEGNTAVVLTPTGRYAHAAAHVERCAQTSGLAIVKLEPCHLRLEAGLPVHGLLVVMRRD